MTKRPSLQFYPADWRNDPALRMCSPAARGLWIDMICIMHEANPYGHLVVSGVAVSPEELAMIVGGTPKDVAKWLDELHRRKVYSVTDGGVIFSRRMVRDETDRDKWRTRQARHRDVTPTVTDYVTPESQRSSSSTSSSVTEVSKSISAVPALRPTRRNLLNGHQEDFDAFYVAYPKHKKRGDAEKAYVAALSLTSPEEILAGAVRYAVERAGQDEQYTQLPGTWLRAKCWLDETGQGVTPVDPEKAAEAKEKADQFLRRGKYAETHS